VKPRFGLSCILRTCCQVWTPSARTRTPDADHIPVASFKAHEGPVNSMTFFRVLGADPQRPPLRLATTGAVLPAKDRRSGAVLSVWRQAGLGTLGT